MKIKLTALTLLAGVSSYAATPFGNIPLVSNVTDTTSFLTQPAEGSSQPVYRVPMYTLATNILTRVQTSLPSLPYLPVVNVKLPPFNAKGDGFTDDTGSFQYAADWIYTNGGQGLIYAPSSTYKVNQINFHPNSPNNGTGNGANWTNAVGIIGETGSTVLFHYGTNNVCLNFGTTDAGKIFQHGIVEGITIFGAGWNGVQNNGSYSNGITSQGIFFGLPGTNAGTVGAQWSIVKNTRVMWEYAGVVSSNTVGISIQDCSLQENNLRDVILAHVDSYTVRHTMFGSVNSTTTRTNCWRCGLLITGTLTNTYAMDAGNGGQVYDGNECNGLFIYGDGVYGLVVEQGDVEDAGALRIAPAAYFFTNYCQATLIGIRVNMLTNYIWCYAGIGGDPAQGVTVINPAFSALAPPNRQQFFRHTGQTVFHPMTIINKQGSGSGSFNANVPGYQDTLWEGTTTNWYCSPEYYMQPFRSGNAQSLEVDGTLYEGMALRTNSFKNWNVRAYSYTNGSDQASPPTIFGKSDVSLLNFQSPSPTVNALQFGYTQTTEGSPPLGLSEIDFYTGNTTGIGTNRLQLDAMGNLRYINNSGVTIFGWGGDRAGGVYTNWFNGLNNYEFTSGGGSITRMQQSGTAYTFKLQGTDTGGASFIIQSANGFAPGDADPFIVKGDGGTTVFGTTSDKYPYAVNGYKSYKSNGSSLMTSNITVSPYFWTNNLGPNIVIYLQGNGTTAITNNGVQIATTVTNSMATIQCSTNDWFSVKWVTTAPVMNFKIE